MSSPSRLAVLLCLFAGLATTTVFSQDTESPWPDSPSQSKEAAGQPPDSPTKRDVTWRSLPRAFAQDQKAIWWTFPGQVARGNHLIPTLAIAGTTAGLIIADKHTMPYFSSHARNLDELNEPFQSPITSGAVILVPASLMVAGYARHDSYQIDTALLSAMAYADSAVVDLAIKAITRRERPSDVPPGAPFTNTFFNGGQSPFKGSSFPSGHAAGAFAVATVVATRYHRHRWVPWAAYGFAGVVSLSRITTTSHFPSDVFLGGALGYTITRYQVLRPR